MNKEILIICESIYNGNTLKLGRSMAGELNCQLVSVRQAENLDVMKYKAVGFGSGIFFARHHPILLDFITKMNFGEQAAFIFSTQGSPILGKYHDPIKKMLIQKGRKIIGEFSSKGYDCTGPFTLVGGGNKGRPNEKDLRRAARFAVSLFPEYKPIDYYHSLSCRNPLREGSPNIYKVNGVEDEEKNVIELKGDLVTVNQNQCTGCGQCVKNCPLSVFELQQQKSSPVRELDCVQCKLCQTYCSSRAIMLHSTWRDSLRVAVRHSKREFVNYDGCLK